MFIRAMHNRVGERVEPREIGRADALIVVPLVAVIVAIAVYPQLALRRAEPSVKASVAGAQAAAQAPPAQASLGGAP
jgi:NADH-quinone oxidoreductase subunit M